MNSLEKRFLIALSFPGERRIFVAEVARALSEQLGQDRILYDGFYEAEFARPNLDLLLQNLYHDESELIVVFLCADYEHKEWTGLEWRAIRNLIKKKQDASIMFARFDETPIPGTFSTDGYVDIKDRLPSEIASLIIERLQIFRNPLATRPHVELQDVGSGFIGTPGQANETQPFGNSQSSVNDAQQPVFLTLDRLRQTLGGHVMPILTAVWQDIGQCWSQTNPGLLYDQFGEEHVRSCLSIYHNPLLRYSDSGKFYSITLLGSMLTDDGPHIEELLIRYVRHIRERHVASNYKLTEVTSSEIDNDLNLTEKESAILWKLWVVPGPFFAASSRNRNGFVNNLPSDIFDAPRDIAEVSAYVRRVVEVYNINAPVKMSDAACGWRTT